MGNVKALIASLDYNGLGKALSENPALANEGLPYDEKNTTLAHPLHRICDGVFSGAYSDDQAVKLAEIFLEHGAHVNGFGLVEEMETPLIAAASLHAEKVGVLYVDRGADIHHASFDGNTALHWAAWVGRDRLVDKLIKAGADIHRKCTLYKSTPLLWAVHGYKFGGDKNHHHQVECVRLLLEAGAEKNPVNAEGVAAADMLGKEDREIKAMLG